MTSLALVFNPAGLSAVSSRVSENLKAICDYWVLLASEDGSVVAAIHSGWRGTVADVVGATITRLSAEAGVEAGRDHCGARHVLRPRRPRRTARRRRRQPQTRQAARR